VSELTEQAIRPIELMAKQKVAALTDVGRMLSRYSEFVEVKCPACDANNSVPKFVKNGISYVECNECSTFYVNPRPSSEVLEWFYRGSPNYAYWNEVIFPASEAARLERIFVPRVDRLLELCQKYAVETDAILEVGAGFGTFCGEVKRRNVFSRVVAVEPTPDLAKTCRERGLEVLELPVEQIQLGNNELFGVVASFEVIEHLFTPGKLDAELVRNKVLSGEFDVSDQPFLQKVLIDEWEHFGLAFQEFLVQQGLSSNMWVIARKPRS